MNELGINSVMLDTSFCIRLLDNTDELHQNALQYYKYFLTEKISIHVSTIAIAEYSVVDDPANLPLDKIRLEAFDFIDAKTAGQFHKTIRGDKVNIPQFNRRIIANDVKILAQLHSKKIDAIISKDLNSQTDYIKPLTKAGILHLKFLALTVPLNSLLGKLF